MTQIIRHAWFALPLCLVFSGCAGSQHIETASRTGSERSVPRPPMVGDHSPIYASAGLPVTDVQHDITMDQINEHVRSGTAVVVDARTTGQFARGHVRDAINVPAGEVDSYLPRFEKAVSRDQFIIIYCNGPSCGSADMVYEHLAVEGYTNMRVFSPGWLKLASAKNLR